MLPIVNINCIILGQALTAFYAVSRMNICMEINKKEVQNRLKVGSVRKDHFHDLYIQLSHALFLMRSYQYSYQYEVKLVY